MKRLISILEPIVPGIRTISAIINRTTLAAATVLLPAAATADEIGLTQNFDRQTPGTFPVGWRYTWRSNGDDIVYVSNVHRLETSGNALIIDRTGGDDHSTYKLARGLGKIGKTDVVLSFCFRIDAAAAQATVLTLEVGPPYPHQTLSLFWSLRDAGPDLYLYPNGLSNWEANWKAKKVLGRFESGSWYRVNLLIPVKGSRRKQAWGYLEKREQDAWQACGKVATIPCPLLLSDNGLFALIPGDKRKGAVFYFDDLKLKTADQADLTAFGQNE